MGSAISIQNKILNLSDISKLQNNILEKETSSNASSNTSSENIFFFINNQYDIGESIFYKFK